MSGPIPVDRSFVPHPQRESSNIGFGDYAWKITKSILITKIGATIGAGIGYVTHSKDRKIGAQLVYFLAGAITGTYEAWKHWQPIKGTQERFEKLIPAVTEELNTDALKEEVKLQQEIKDGLQKRQTLLMELVKKQSPIESRGTSAVDALEKTTSAVTPQRS